MMMIAIAITRVVSSMVCMRGSSSSISSIIIIMMLSVGRERVPSNGSHMSGGGGSRGVVIAGSYRSGY